MINAIMLDDRLVDYVNGSENIEIEDNTSNINNKNIESKIILPNLDKIFIDLIENHYVEIKGEVVSEGYFPIANLTSVNDVIEMLSGGFSLDADTENIEISNAINLTNDQKLIGPGGSVFVPKHNFDKTSIIFESTFLSID